MTYNTTAIEATNTTLGFMQEANNLSDGMIGAGMSIVWFIVAFTLVYGFTRSLGKAMLSASFPAFFVTGFLFLAARLVDWYLPIFYLVLIVVGIILQTKRDNSYG